MEDRKLTLARMLKSKARRCLRDCEELRRLAAELERELSASEDLTHKEETDDRTDRRDAVAGSAG